MRIQLLSDLHLESNPDYDPIPAPGADLLVLAGDIGSYQSGSSLITKQDNDFGLQRFSPRLGWPTPVIMVAGNHEYDAMDLDEAHNRLSEVCERLGITLLEKQTLMLKGGSGEQLTGFLGLPSTALLEAPPIRLIATTLWSDFDLIAVREKNTTGLYREREKAFRAANFYLEKMAARQNGELFLAQQMRERSLDCQAWLRDALAKPFDGKTIVVTHFAPSAKSQDPRFAMGPSTAGFCNALDDLLPSADLWLHGHLHCPSDYRVGKCRVVANPRGYARKNEQAKFMDTFCVELGIGDSPLFSDCQKNLRSTQQYNFS